MTSPRWRSGSPRSSVGGVRTTPRGEARVKRTVDLVVAGIGLIVLSPLLLVVGLLVLVTLGPPVVFRQQRPGLDGRPFTLYKFRSMRAAGAGAASRGPMPSGSPGSAGFLRRTSLDELPELWNVLRGEMSLVGPRPLLMEYLPLYTPEQARRHEVLPGITGWAQVNGRNAISWEEKFRLDVWYVDHRSLSARSQDPGADGGAGALGRGHQRARPGDRDLLPGYLADAVARRVRRRPGHRRLGAGSPAGARLRAGRAAGERRGPGLARRGAGGARSPSLAGRVFRGAEFRNPASLEALGALGLDYIVGVHFPYSSARRRCGFPAMGVLNLHPALLPYNRGWHTASWAILDGTPAGATLHFMDEGVDTGDIVHQREQVVSPADTADTLYQRVKRLELEVFREGWAMIEAGSVPPHAQPPAGGLDPPAGGPAARRGPAHRPRRAGARGRPAPPTPGPHHQYPGRSRLRRARRGAVRRPGHPASGALSGLPTPRGSPLPMSLTVKFSDRFVAERRYVFDVLLGEFLGLAYTVQIDPGMDGYLRRAAQRAPPQDSRRLLRGPRRFDRLHRSELSAAPGADHSRPGLRTRA